MQRERSPSRARGTRHRAKKKIHEQRSRNCSRQMPAGRFVFALCRTHIRVVPLFSASLHLSVSNRRIEPVRIKVESNRTALHCTESNRRSPSPRRSTLGIRLAPDRSPFCLYTCKGRVQGPSAQISARRRCSFIHQLRSDCDAQTNFVQSSHLCICTSSYLAAAAAAALRCVRSEAGTADRTSWLRVSAMEMQRRGRGQRDRSSGNVIVAVADAVTIVAWHDRTPARLVSISFRTRARACTRKASSESKCYPGPRVD